MKHSDASELPNIKQPFFYFEEKPPIRTIAPPKFNYKQY